MLRQKARAAAALVVVQGVLVAPALAQSQTGIPARVDSIFLALNAPDRPGAAVAVLKDGAIVLERGYGSAQLEHRVPITPATVFHVASVTKQFTAFGIALLAQRGALSLDDEIHVHLPELPDLGQPVTIRQLVHHTSGVRDQWELLAMSGWRLDDVITKDHILAAMRRQRGLNFEPGSEHLYSNMGYTLLAEIVERAGGKPFPEWMRENVFAPLGMTSTHMHDDHEHVVPGRAYSYRRGQDGEWRNAVLSYANAGATSLFTTVGDLARWLHNFETGTVGGTAAIAQMRQRGVLTNGDTLAYAFAIVRGERRGRTTWSHSGGDAGFRSFVVHLPEERLGVVVLSNDAGSNPGALASAVAELYLPAAPALAAPPSRRADPETPTRSRPSVDDAILASVAGSYYSPELETLYRIVVDDGRLVARHARHGEIRLEAVDRDTWSGSVWFFRRVAFTRGEDGSVDGFLLTGGRVRNLRFERLPDGALPGH
jgi:CubicO group peptidase (beta-lactamase class C family)